MHPWYDCAVDDCIVGKQIKSEWSFGKFQLLSEEFDRIKNELEPLLKHEVYLIGMQDIT